MNVLDIITIFLIYIIGALLSLVITGLLVNKLVIKRIMENPEVKDTIRIFKEGKEALKKILENQKHVKS